MIKNQKNVGDLMISLDEYAVVDEDMTLLQALFALDQAQTKVTDGLHRHRAVLVRDKKGRLIGKVGHLAFLRALRTTRDNLGQKQLLLHAGVSEDMIEISSDIFESFDDDIQNLCSKTRSMKVAQAMVPFSDQLNTNDSLYDALKKFVHCDTLSLLVIDKNKAVGLLRLVDLFDEIAATMKHCAENRGDSNA